MAEKLLVETSFLIDLERERRRADPESAPATRFLEHHRTAGLFITATIAGEIAAALEADQKPIWDEFLSPFRRLPIDSAAEWHYGQTYRYLARQGMNIGANDLWIAAVALANQIPVVTANAEHFERVPQLAVRAYREV